MFFCENVLKIKETINKFNEYFIQKLKIEKYLKNKIIMEMFVKYLQIIHSLFYHQSFGK